MSWLGKEVTLKKDGWNMYRRTSEMVREEEETGQNDAIIAFLKTHAKVKAVDIAERLYSTIHMSVGEVQLYLGDLIDKQQVAVDKQGYHSWIIDR